MQAGSQGASGRAEVHRPRRGPSEGRCNLAASSAAGADTGVRTRISGGTAHHDPHSVQPSAATIRAVERPEEKPRNPAQRGDDTGRGTARGEAAQSSTARRRYGPWNGPRRSRAIQHSAATIRAVERPEEKPRNPAQRGDDTGRGTARGEAAQSSTARRRYGPWNGPRRSRAIQHSAATIRAVERPGNGGPTRQNLNPSGASNVADNMESIAGGAIPPFGLGCIAGPARIVCIGPGLSSESVLLRW